MNNEKIIIIGIFIIFMISMIFINNKPVHPSTGASAAGGRCASGFCENPTDCPQCATGFTCSVQPGIMCAGTCYGTCSKALSDPYNKFTKNKSFTVNTIIPNTDEEKRMGLMFIKHLGFNNGMLFHNINSVWMKNTYIPLDVIFLDNNYIVVGYVEDTIPLSLKSISINKNFNHILEVNSGFVRQNKIKIGNKLNPIII